MVRSSAPPAVRVLDEAVALGQTLAAQGMGWKCAAVWLQWAMFIGAFTGLVNWWFAGVAMIGSLVVERVGYAAERRRQPSTAPENENTND